MRIFRDRFIRDLEKYFNILFFFKWFRVKRNGKFRIYKIDENYIVIISECRIII